jgi:Icc-related predicted phosphoesterase
MKLLIFSDIHGDLRALEKLMAQEADYYFAAGDMVTWARGFDAAGEVLGRRAGKVYVLPGNHESHAQTVDMCRRYGLEDFHGKTLEIGGFHVAGLGYSNPTPFHTPGEYSEKELAQRLEPFAALSPLILICHAPPWDTPLDRVRLGLHAGSRAVAEFLAKTPPRWFFCGHIHEAEGVETQIGPTRARNVGKRGYLLDFDKIDL